MLTNMKRVARSAVLLTLALCWPVTGALAQTQHTANQPASAAEDTRPLPDIPTLMHEVEARQKTAEAIQKNYIYHSTVTEQESDGHNGIRKTETRGYDVFWVEGVEVSRLTKKDGKDLSAKEQQKENNRLNKEIAKAKKKREEAEQQGKSTDPRGNDEITVSRILELGSFSNPRRIKLNGRDTIVVDYTGDPKAKTKNRAETVFRDLVGTVWVDEQDHVLVKAEGHFVNAFKIGAGLVINIHKGTSFSMAQTKINNEVWLPEMFEGQGEARMLLLFNFKGTVRMVNSDYRKFRTTSTILPEMGIPSQP
ncbi:hypothetical protein GCM10011507_00340 [Edaphobacter acidisoli]|uniref:Uncharacterized protein n=2 Tax=Edaphobacter acidisoli TaxID=2040573 RepID=A0A916VYE7_9BACT|nr:hypothetical protein GCM10011507_00340 [Edaphobacter acidisoli]